MPTVFAIHTRPGTHLVVRRAVATLPGTELAGRSTSAVEAERVFDTLAPDAVTMDVRLPDGDGIELALRLRARRPELCVVLFSPPDTRLLRRAVSAGITTHVTPPVEVAEAAAAIGVCLSGGASFGTRSLARLLREAAEPGKVELSPREREVGRLLAAGLSPAEMAEVMHVSESTVKTYLARARAKIGLPAEPFRRRMPPPRQGPQH
ncbi:LuxR C-terminal-related transcriptional regulator [Plantactinospora siamensis]|uniref:LuxR C-terminal-related transcriptional regulator n=1 Tax=Plantactinospora siamensis TaxID=555372 RepID=A0ABV6NQF8_9ACTN